MRSRSLSPNPPDRTGPHRTGPDRTGPDRARPDRAGPDRPGWLALALGFVTATLGVACVTPGTHREVASERDQLTTRNHELEQEIADVRRSNQNLDDERVKLVEQNEELLDRNEALEKQVAQLRRNEADLSTTLVAAQTQLAAQEQEVDRLRGTYAGLVADLESEVAAGQIEIERLREGIRLNVADEILFASGQAEIGREGAAVLRKVAAQLAKNDQRIEVQGHSDNTQIRGRLRQRYPSNWDLAAARASSVVRLLQGEGIAGERLSAVSFAEFRPIATNDDAEGRGLNRRIEIRLLPPDEATTAAAPEPAGPPAGP